MINFRKLPVLPFHTSLCWVVSSFYKANTFSRKEEKRGNVMTLCSRAASTSAASGTRTDSAASSASCRGVLMLTSPATNLAPDTVESTLSQWIAAYTSSVMSGSVMTGQCRVRKSWWRWCLLMYPLLAKSTALNSFLNSAPEGGSENLKY